MKNQRKYLTIATLASLVIAFIATVSIGAPRLSKTTNHKRDVPSNLKQLNTALLMYAQDYDWMLPPMKSASGLKAVLYPYVSDVSVFIDPKSQEPFQPNPSISQRHLHEVLKESFRRNQAIFTFYQTPAQNNDARYVCLLPIPDVKFVKEVPDWADAYGSFLECKTKIVSKSQWEKLKKASDIS